MNLWTFRQSHHPAAPIPPIVAEQDFLSRLHQAVQDLIREDYTRITESKDGVANSLLPLVEHYRASKFHLLKMVANVWVAQTTPLLALAKTRADMVELGIHTQTIAGAIDELLSSIESVGETSSSVAQEAREAQTRAEAGSVSAEAAMNSIAAAAAAVSDLSHKVDSLSTSIEKISSIVTTIEDIASQTNLLALNATIEAARAGEAGKGFTVVAGEVKTLSHQTAKATEDIRGRISGLQGGMADILAAMRSSGHTVEAGTQAVLRTSEAIKAINRTVEIVTTNIATIADIVHEQMTATTQVDKSVNITAGMSENVLKTLYQLSTTVDTMSEVILPELKAFGAHPDDREMIQLARTDHATYTKSVIDVLVERSPAPSAPLHDQAQCRFGKWYLALPNQTLKSSNAYRRIEDPHRRVHHFGQKAIDLYRSGNLKAAVEAATEMSKAAGEIFVQLDDMERILAAQNVQ